MRTGKTVTNSSGATTNYSYVYENGMLQKMTRGSRILDFSYDASGNPVSIKYRSSATATPTYYYYALNSRGDVTSLYNSDGSVAAIYTYDAYGKLLSVKTSAGIDITGSTNVANLNPLRYRGYVYDNETGFYYLQSRYYDPSTCRFINADGYCSTGQGILGNNMYAYCNNNPIVLSDNLGLRPVIGSSIQKESAAERKLSCAYMNGDTTSVVDLTDKLNECMSHNLYHFSKTIYVSILTLSFPVTPAVSFYYSVKDGGKYDLKLQDDWEFEEGAIYTYGQYVLRYDDPGNINYGYVGSALFPEEVLCWAAGINQQRKFSKQFGNADTYFDDPRDQIMIRIGCKLFREGLM